MKERFKSFLLILLVATSVMFTKRLWIELPNESADIFSNNQVYSAPYKLIDMIAPNKFLLNFSESNHTLFYDDSKYNIWADTKDSLSKVLNSKNFRMEKLDKEEFNSYNSKRSIAFNFPGKINTYILAKALEVKEPNDIVDTIPNIDMIYLYLGSGDPFFVFSYEDENLAVYDTSINISSIKEKISKIEQEKKYNYYHSMKETMGTSKDIYVPYEMKNNLPKIYVENEIRTLDESSRRQMAERFFNKGIDYIREITERNGSTIYVHNKRVLKLNVNGVLEYFHPLEENINKRNLYESMNTASEFISLNTGVPKGMYLDSVEEIEGNNSLGYKLKFKYRIRGIPVILGNREVVDFVEIEVFNNHVRSYKHFIRKDMNLPVDNILIDKKMLSSFDVIDMNDEFIIAKYLEENEMDPNTKNVSIKEVLSSIEDISLSYFDPCLKDKGDELVGVWAIRTEKGLYAFDVYKGNLVYEEN